MKVGTTKIAWLWIGSSAIGYLVGGILASSLFPFPPYDHAAPEGPRNQYNLQEVGYALAVGLAFAVSQWLVLRYILAVYCVPGSKRTLLWIPASTVGIATTVFFAPGGMPMFFLIAAILPTLPGMVVLGLSQWLILRWLIRARFIWIFLTIIGGAVGAYVAVLAGVMAGAAASSLVFGGCIGIFQAVMLTTEFDADLRRRGSTKATG